MREVAKILNLLLNKAKARKKQQPQKNSVKEWLPITDIRGQTVKSRNGAYLAFLRISPMNLSLKSENEKRRIVSAFHEVLNGVRDPIQIFSIGRPIDLDVYIRNIGKGIDDETNIIKKRLLKEYVRYSSGLVSEGEAHEQRFYIIISKTDEASVISSAHELSNNLQSAGLESYLCEGQEIMDLLFCFFNPDKISTEKAVSPGTLLPPIYFNKEEKLK